MSDWTSPFSFGIFYQAVYERNTALYQYNVVSILLGSGMEYSQDMASKYCCGQVPISGERIYEIMNLEPAEIEKRIAESGIRDRQTAVRAIVLLLRSDHIDMSDEARKELILQAEKDDPLLFLANMLKVSVNCPKSQLKKITTEMREDIRALRTGEIQDNKKTAQAGVPDSEAVLTEMKDPGYDENREKEKPKGDRSTDSQDPMMCSYSVKRLDYEKDREQIKKQLSAPDSGRPLTEDEVYACLDLIRRSAVSYMISFHGTSAGLSDLMAHRIPQERCSQIMFSGMMKSEMSLGRIRRCLGNTARFKLSDEGRMFLAAGYDPQMGSGEYRFTIIYSLERETRAEQIMEQAAREEYCLALMPWDKYAGRVPDLLSPVPDVRNAYDSTNR